MNLLAQIIKSLTVNQSTTTDKKRGSLLRNQTPKKEDNLSNLSKKRDNKDGGSNKMQNRGKVINKLALVLLSIVVLELVLIGDQVQPVKAIKKKILLKKLKKLLPLFALIKPKKKIILLPIPIPMFKDQSGFHKQHSYYNPTQHQRPVYVAQQVPSIYADASGGQRPTSGAPMRPQIVSPMASADPASGPMMSIMMMGEQSPASTYLNLSPVYSQSKLPMMSMMSNGDANLSGFGEGEPPAAASSSTTTTSTTTSTAAPISPAPSSGSSSSSLAGSGSQSPAAGESFGRPQPMAMLVPTMTMTIQSEPGGGSNIELSTNLSGAEQPGAPLRLTNERPPPGGKWRAPAQATGSDHFAGSEDVGDQLPGGEHYYSSPWASGRQPAATLMRAPQKWPSAGQMPFRAPAPQYQRPAQLQWQVLSPQQAAGKLQQQHMSQLELEEIAPPPPPMLYLPPIAGRLVQQQPPATSGHLEQEQDAGDEPVQLQPQAQAQTQRPPAAQLKLAPKPEAGQARAKLQLEPKSAAQVKTSGRLVSPAAAGKQSQQQKQEPAQRSTKFRKSVAGQ